MDQNCSPGPSHVPGDPGNGGRRYRGLSLPRDFPRTKLRHAYENQVISITGLTRWFLIFA